jgi:MSHA biogenesis protein MshN
LAEPPRSNAPAHISKQPTDGSTANERAESEYRRGVSAIRRGDMVEGGEAFRAALRIAPTHAPARQALLAQLTEQQRWADVETLALDGVGLQAQRSDWALLAARLMYERGEASGALAVLDQYAGAARQNPDYQILRAQRAGRNAEAADCYQTALAIRPQESRWWYGLGRALDADHREAAARQAYEKARETGNLPADLQQAVERRLR